MIQTTLLDRNAQLVAGTDAVNMISSELITNMGVITYDVILRRFSGMLPIGGNQLAIGGNQLAIGRKKTIPREGNGLDSKKDDHNSKVLFLTRQI